MKPLTDIDYVSGPITLLDKVAQEELQACSDDWPGGCDACPVREECCRRFDGKAGFNLANDPRQVAMFRARLREMQCKREGLHQAGADL